MENDILNFLTNEILDMFCSYKNQAIWDTLRDMLLRHGSQSEELISNDLFITNNEPDERKNRKPSYLKDLNYKKRLLCKSARIIICFMLTVISHFKEEARKDMIPDDGELKQPNKPGEFVPRESIFRCF
jgi:hypothetical protein